MERAFESYEVATYETAHTYLRPILPHDYPEIFVAETGSFLGDRWRNRARTPSFEEFVSTLFNGVLAQYMIVAKLNAVPLGYVTLYDVQMEHGFGYLAATRFNETDRSGRVLQGVLKLIDVSFGRWPLRRLYAVSSEYSSTAFTSGVGRLLEEAARLKGHEYWKGQYWDQITYVIGRDRWDEWRPKYERMIGVS